MHSDRSGSESFQYTDNIISNSLSYNEVNEIEEEFLKFLEDVELNTDKYELKLKETYYTILNINLEKENFGK
jgi:hypothetical protein